MTRTFYVKVYGIPNCNTVKKARQWLSDHDVAYEFHDFKKQGITESMLTGWIQKLGWEKLVNRKGTTWRQLPEETKATIDNEGAAIALMLEKPSVIKRPVLEAGTKLELGFDESAYEALLK
jgi:arsenate reductase